MIEAPKPKAKKAKKAAEPVVVDGEAAAAPAADVAAGAEAEAKPAKKPAAKKAAAKKTEA